jgi:hypothetical protein
MMHFFRGGGYHFFLWRASISRPLAPVAWVSGVDDTTRPRRQGDFQWMVFSCGWKFWVILLQVYSSPSQSQPQSADKNKKKK